MSTVFRDDTFLDAQDAPSSSDETLVRKCPVGDFPKVRPIKAETDDADEDLPILKLMRSHERPPTIVPKPISDTRAPTRVRGLPVTLLTADAAFATQLTSALESDHDVHVVDSVDAAAQHAVAHRCPILITDAVVTRAAIELLTTRLRAHDPDAAVIVAGSRDQGGMLIGLQSAGVVDGFLLKPVTSAGAQLVIDAATRRHREEHRTDSSTRMRSQTRPPRTQRSQASVDPDQTIVVARSPSPHGDSPQSADHSRGRATAAQKSANPQSVKRSTWPHASWSIVVIVAIAVAAGTWWTVSQREPAFDPQTLIAKHLALADDAKLAGRWTDPRNGAAHHYQAVLAIDPDNIAALRGLDRVASELSRQTQLYMKDHRFADAALSLTRLRELQPDYPELPLLDSQLQALQAEVVASTAAAAALPAAAAPTPPIVKRERSSPRSTREPAEAAMAIPRTRAPILAPPIVEQAKVDAVAPVALSVPKLDETKVPAPAGTIPSQTSTAESTAATASQSQPAPSRAPTARALVDYVPPVYPPEAFQRSMEGWVTVSMLIGEDGKVSDARVEGGEKRQLFGRAALAAVRQWRYAPRDATSAPAGERVTVKLSFKLKD